VQQHQQQRIGQSPLDAYLSGGVGAAQDPWADAFADLAARSAAGGEGGSSSFGVGAAYQQAQQEEEEAEDVDLGLDESVQNWSDFLKAGIHARSVFTVPAGQGVGASVSRSAHKGTGVGLDTASAGAEMWSGSGTSDHGEALRDGFRRWLEDTDHLTGIHAFMDADGGWGGYAAGFMEDVVREECPRVPILAMPVVQPWDSRDTGQVQGGYSSAKGASQAGAINVRVGASGSDLSAVRDLSVATTVASLLGVADVTLPLGLESFAALASVRRSVLRAGGKLGHSKLALGATRGVDDYFPLLGGDFPLFNPFHSSALLAMGVDVATAPHRRSAKSDPLGDGMPALDLRMQSHAASTADGRQRGDGALTREQMEAAMSTAATVPLLRAGCSLGDTLSVLQPSNQHKVASLSLALPFVHPNASTAGLEARLKAAPPLYSSSRQGAPDMSFLSGVAVGDVARSARLPGAARAAEQAAFSAEVLGNRTPAGQYISLRFGGEVSLGSVMALRQAALRCGAGSMGVRAGVAISGTPIPLPLTTPRSLFGPLGAAGQANAQQDTMSSTDARPSLAYSADGAVVQVEGDKRTRVMFGQHPWRVHAAATASSSLSSASAARQSTGPAPRDMLPWRDDPAALHSVSTAPPFTVAALGHVSTAPVLAGPLRALAAAAGGSRRSASSAVRKAATRTSDGGVDCESIAEELLSASDVLLAGQHYGAAMPEM